MNGAEFLYGDGSEPLSIFLFGVVRERVYLVSSCFVLVGVTVNIRSMHNFRLDAMIWTVKKRYDLHECRCLLSTMNVCVPL